MEPAVRSPTPPGPALIRLVRICPGVADLPTAGLPVEETPVERWEVPGLPREVWLKRDDRCAVRVGGNKARKLDLLLGDALARRCRSVVTVGGEGSNHLLTTALCARRVGLEPWGVAFRQAPSPATLRNLRCLGRVGMRLVHVPNRPALAWGVALAWLRAPRPCVVGPGGSSPLGTLGLVAAGLELAAQVERGEAPCPAAVVVPLGSGGTAAGLALGLALAGLPTRVLAVRVVEGWIQVHRAVRLLVTRTARLLRRLGAPPPRSPVALQVIHGFQGPGYALPSPAAERAVLRAASLGETFPSPAAPSLPVGSATLPLETTYTGKALAAVLEGGLPADLPPGPVVFWMTWPGPGVAEAVLADGPCPWEAGP